MGRRKRGWNVAAAMSLDDLRRMIEERESSISSRRDQLLAELEAVDAELSSSSGGQRRGRKPGKRGPGRPPKSRRGSGRPPKPGRATGKRPGRKPGPKGQSDLHNRLRDVLKGSSEPLKATDIAKKVLRGGYETRSKVFHLIVGQRLAEMKDVKKPGRGLYAIG